MPRSLSSVCTNLASSQQCYNTCVSTETIFFSAQHISTNDHENTANIGFGITNKFSYIGKFTNTEFMNNEVRLYTHTHTHNTFVCIFYMYKFVFSDCLHRIVSQTWTFLNKLNWYIYFWNGAYSIYCSSISSMKRTMKCIFNYFVISLRPEGKNLGQLNNFNQQELL